MKFCWLLSALLLLSTASLFVGVSQLSLSALFAGDSAAWALLIDSRLPRLFAILLSGAGLSIAGLVMQQISQNRFAAPSTSGTVECTMLGYLLSILLVGHAEAIWLIFLCAIIGTLVFIQLIQSIQFKNAVFVPLIGLIFGNIIESLVTFIAYKYDALQNLSSWTVANFANILQGDFELLYIAVPIALFTYLYATQISAVGIGKSFAVNLGLNYRQIVTAGVILVSIMTASVVMIVGKLPFLGLIVPNIVAHFNGDNLKRNIPLTALLGSCVVLGCDLLSRVVIFPYELPILMIISLVAGGIFIFLLLRRDADDR